jgi:serine/threonine-protein kinase
VGVVDVPLPLGAIIAGKYRVERMLGAGGMGVVAAGRHVKLGHKVAIKMLRPSSIVDHELVARFEREAQAASRLTSDHVVRILDVGERDDGVPFIVMEYLDGRDLARVLKEDGPLSPRMATDYVLQACEALAEAHKKGIIHRDMKPANLFLARRADGSEIIKVLDFGISKLVRVGLAGEELTRSEIIMGSPQYMAPEQLKSARSVDARADVWSLGAILFKLVTDRFPFGGRTTAEVCASVLTVPTPRVSSHRKDVPRELDDAVAKALEKDQENRFSSVLELAQALAPVASEDGSTSIRAILHVLSRTEGPASMPPPPMTSEPTRIRVQAPSSSGSVHVTFGGSTAALVKAARPRSLAPLWIGIAALAATAVVIGYRSTAERTPATGMVAPPPPTQASEEIPPPPAESSVASAAPTTSGAKPVPRALPPAPTPVAAAKSAPAPAPAPPPPAPTPTPTGLSEYGGRK